MKPNRYRLWLLLTVVVLAGCASGVPESVKLTGAGKFRAVTQYVDGQYASFDQAPMLDRNLACIAYYEIRNYDRFRACSQIIVDHPDPSYETYPGASETYMSGDEVRGVMHGYRARMHLDFGQYQQALESADKALELIDRAKNRIRLVFLKLPPLETRALALVHLGREADARAVIPEIEAQQTFVPMARGELSRIRQRALGKIYFSLGDYPQARQALESEDMDPLAGIFKGFTLAYTDLEEGIDELSQINLLPRAFMLTRAYFETGEIEKARSGYDTLLADPRTKNFGNIYWAALADRARLHWKDGESAQAVDKLKEAVSVIEQQRSSIQLEANKIGFVGDKQKVYLQLVDYLVREKRTTDAFVYAEKAKARALIDILAAKSTFGGNAERPPVDLAKLDRLEAQLAEASTDVARKADADRTRAIIVETRRKVQTDSPEVASLISVGDIDLDLIRNRLGTDELLLEYFGGQQNLFAFVVTGNSVKAIRLDGRNLADTVRRFREEILRPENDAYRSTSQALYRSLIQPVAPLLDRPRLTVVPHGPLHYLPFGALYDGREHMIEQFSIRILPSASVMAYLEKDRSAATAFPLLALGNPDLGNPQLALPGAEKEVLQIGGVFPDGRVLIRGEATETLVKRYGHEAGILHIASHGEFNPEAPLNSRLLLAPGEGNDGNLTVEELYDLNLASDLVTLSACQTGLGDIQSGDDVIGLTRGFLFAGASSIVASLWVVDDDATALLMTAMYDGLKGKSKRDALRTAQLSVKENYHPHPFYWAAFQITGSAN